MGVAPDRVLAWLGPAIEQEMFEVGPEVREQFVARSAENEHAFKANARGRWQAMRLESRNVQTGHRTSIEYEEFAANVGVPDDVFTTRYMEREQ